MSASAVFSALNAALDGEVERAVLLRHRLHQDPCLSGDEAGTAALLAAELGLAVQPVAGTGFTTRLGPEGPAIGIRTELDALPVSETTGVEWSSVNGAMHACGHDVHQAAFVAFIRAAAAVDLPVAIAAMAQPREEVYPSGASDMVESGVLEFMGVKAVLALHVHPGLPQGAVSTGSGPINAAADEFEILIHGRGGHGAYPHLATDPVPIAAHLTLALYELLRGTIDPAGTATLTVAQLQAGSATNIIPDSAVLRGTVRTMSAADQDRMHRGLRRTAEHVCAAFGADATVRITRGEPVLINDAALARCADRWLAAAGLQVLDPPRSCGADDFAFFTQRVPGLMAFLGVDCRVDGRQPALHSTSFLPSDPTVEQAARALAALYVGAAEKLGVVGRP